jgi:hypothetical protein
MDMFFLSKKHVLRRWDAGWGVKRKYYNEFPGVRNAKRGDFTAETAEIAE